MPRRSRNRPVVDWIQFDSPEEVEVYLALKEWKLDKLTDIAELKSARLLNARVEPIILCSWFKAWSKVVRKREYTYDFDIVLNKEKIALEVKSSWSEQKPDYRLRRFLFLFLKREDYNFAELIKVKKWVWKFIKYF